MYRFTNVEFIGSGFAKGYDKNKNRYYLIDILNNNVFKTPYKKIENIYGDAFIVTAEDNRDYLLNTKSDILFSAPKIYANDGRQCLYKNEEGKLLLDRPAIVKSAPKEFDSTLNFKTILSNGVLCLEQQIKVYNRKYEKHATATYYFDKMGKLVMGKRSSRTSHKYIENKIFSYNDEYMIGSKTYSDEEAIKIINQASGFNRELDTKGLNILTKNKDAFHRIKSKIYENEKDLEPAL